MDDTTRIWLDNIRISDIIMLNTRAYYHSETNVILLSAKITVRGKTQVQTEALREQFKDKFKRIDFSFDDFDFNKPAQIIATNISSSKQGFGFRAIIKVIDQLVHEIEEAIKTQPPQEMPSYRKQAHAS